jgi:pimeloyl-ACP methyl ester carboxylesterase
MKYFTIFLSLLFYSFLFIPIVNAETCPKVSDTDRYVITKMRAEKQGDVAGLIRVYYKLLNSFDPQKPTLLVINGGPGGDHSIIDVFHGTELEKKMNIVGFDHRGLGCTHSFSPWKTYYEESIYSMSRASDDIDAIRKDLLGDHGKWFIYGISYGTFLGQQYAIKYPQYINGLILDSAFHDSKAIDKARQQYVSLFIRSNKASSNLFDQVVRKYGDLKTTILLAIWTYTYSYDGRTKGIPHFLELLDSSPSRADVEKILADYIDFNIPMIGMTRQIVCEEIWDFSNNEDANSYYWTIFNKNCGVFKKNRTPMAFGEDLKKLNVRTFIWGGRFDPVTPIQAMREMHTLIPHSLIWEHPYAGHGLIVESSACALKLADMFFSGRSDEEIESLANSPACQSVPSTTFAETQRILKKMTFPGGEFPIF